MSELVTDTEELPRLGRSLALAYAANPLVRWMFADDLSFPRLEGLFTSLVEFGLRYGLVYASAESVGVAIWIPPIGDARFSLDQLTPDVAADTAEWSSGRRGAALEALASNRPSEPHFYLDALGVVPACRRRGMASALLKPALEECDATAISAYLENSDPANISFYIQHGFEEVDQIDMPKGAPPVSSMWRPPKLV